MAPPAMGYAAAGVEPQAQTLPLETGLVEAGDVSANPVEAADGQVDGTELTGRAQGLVAPNSTGTSVTKRELAFLDDKSLSIEEKIFQFMCLMTRKADQELVATMKVIEGKKSASSSSSSSGSTGSSSTSGASTTGSGSTTSGSSAGTGASDDAGSGIGDDVKSFVHDHAGDALALGATALGFPELAPVAKAVGPYVGDAIGAGIDAVGSYFGGGKPMTGELLEDLLDRAKGASPDEGVSDATDSVAAQADQSAEPTVAAKATSSTGSSTASTAAGGIEDEKLDMLNLERLVQKQDAMFNALSNVLKSFNDTRMAVIQNLK
jgi:hypothetical protein